MRGADYDSIEAFKKACIAHDQPLDPANVLAKVYLMDELKDIAQIAGFRFNVIDEPERNGVGRRYEFAEKIAEQVGTERIGLILSKNDHDSHFQYLSYAKMTSINEYSSRQAFISNLTYRGFQVENSFVQFFNGMTQPAGRNCSLESILIPENVEQISLVYSFTRVLTIPDATNQFSIENLFLARIPLIVRFYFDARLIEFSMPFYSEAMASQFNYNNKIPNRFQLMVDSVIFHIQNSLGLTLGSIDLNNYMLYLESQPGVEDMGWKIIPQLAASFDLKQGVIPLKKILDTFSVNLKQEIQNRGLAHPLSNINLYELFRAIKEQSYTETMVLKVPFGQRGGNFLIGVIYGEQNSKYLPLVTISKNSSALTERLKLSIYESQQTVQESPYNFDSLFANQCAN